ncbi:hypothetical protein GALMADRAFT_281680 [Galerina marginata CBS 339.88]|uniref:Uncharacterized protein n=1 Tax=Galerina marginata (strain CBS 339.88) TaxID=685588 RepID=A0A067SLS2_GALM3|nr:hypothetical protein GALMADRAFT_281680 [Galerina marginata CBS 339.88]
MDDVMACLGASALVILATEDVPCPLTVMKLVNYTMSNGRLAIMSCGKPQAWVCLGASTFDMRNNAFSPILTVAVTGILLRGIGLGSHLWLIKDDKDTPEGSISNIEINRA